MTGNQDRNQIGEQMRAAVQEALTTGDFKNFNAVVADTVNQALKESMASKTEKRQTYTHPAYARAAEKKRQEQMKQESAARAGQASQRKPVTTAGKASPATKIRMNKVGNVASILYMTFGGIGVGVTSILLIIFISLLFVTGSLTPLFITGGIWACFMLMLKAGCDKRNLLKRAWRYIELCGNRNYINIEDLAAHTGKSRRTILKDVKKMIRMNIYPEGHLDAGEKCLMLNDATFQEYLNLERERKKLIAEQPVQKLTEASGKKNENPELAAMIREGNDTIVKLRKMNDAILGEVISQKLFRLEHLLQEIFERVEEHPEQMPQMQKFMNYYLPTTLKLVEAYEEFDSVSVQGKEILEAKAEIEKTLDTINQAFAELLNKLFTATVYDVTTDAQVLQTMLSKDGLTKDQAFTNK